MALCGPVWPCVACGTSLLHQPPHYSYRYKTRIQVERLVVVLRSIHQSSNASHHHHSAISRSISSTVLYTVALELSN